MVSQKVSCNCFQLKEGLATVYEPLTPALQPSVLQALCIRYAININTQNNKRCDVAISAAPPYGEKASETAVSSGRDSNPLSYGSPRYAEPVIRAFADTELACSTNWWFPC